MANAAHIRNVSGRKTDVNDAMWIADLLAHGLIRASFVPPQAIQQLRDLTRTRKQLVREVSQHSLRIQKVLEDANLKLGSVLSDVPGKSGRAMLDAIVAGQTDPATLAGLAQGTARQWTAELREALRGRITEHHRTMLRLHLQVIDALQRTLAELDVAVGKALAPIRQRARLLTLRHHDVGRQIRDPGHRRCQEGHPGSGRIDADGGLPHVARRGRMRRPGCRLPRPPRPLQNHPPLAQTPSGPRLWRAHRASCCVELPSRFERPQYLALPSSRPTPDAEPNGDFTAVSVSTSAAGQRLQPLQRRSSATGREHHVPAEARRP
jgi:hypothetical protein